MRLRNRAWQVVTAGLMLMPGPPVPQEYVVSTVAGGGLPGGLSGTSASLAGPSAVAVDRDGNVFVAIQRSHIVLRWDAGTGSLKVVAGNGTVGFSGDNGAAINSQLSAAGVAVDTDGKLYIADPDNNRVRRVSDGVITTVAGNGLAGFAGDNGPATAARLFQPHGVAVDSLGNLYIADTLNGSVRRVSNGVITTVAGSGVDNFGGDNGPATNAKLDEPTAVAVDSAGSLYVADYLNNRIRKVSNGVITTVAGTGQAGFSGDHGPATSAQLHHPRSIAVDTVGDLYVSDTGNARVRKLSNGVITTVAGNGDSGFGGDNGPAIVARMTAVGIAVDSVGRLYIADEGNGRVRRVENGAITTVAGNGTSGFSGDNRRATDAQLSWPSGVAVDSAGKLYIADMGNGSIRKVSNGVITTVAGTGVRGFKVENGRAKSVSLSGPQAVAVDSAGNLYIADTSTASIRKVSRGVMTTVAGTGAYGFGGDNGPASSAALSGPAGVTVDSADNLYIADTGNNRIRKVSNGIIRTVAGNGHAGFSGDNGPATSASLCTPYGIAVDSAGTLYIADAANNRVRKVSNGVITTVAGAGLVNLKGDNGDNGSATRARILYPVGIALDSAGRLYIAEQGYGSIRKVEKGVITTIAGGGAAFGDHGPAISAQFSYLSGIAVGRAGRLYIVDQGNSRVRLLDPRNLRRGLFPAGCRVRR